MVSSGQCVTGQNVIARGPMPATIHGGGQKKARLLGMHIPCENIASNMCCSCLPSLWTT